MSTIPTALTVAGSDSGGGAGIQADLRAFSYFGVFGTTAVTAVTAQSPHKVSGISPVPAETVGEQMTAVLDAFDVRAAKTGMLFSAEVVERVAQVFAGRSPLPLVVDPVMVATSGARLLERDAGEALRERLLPLASLMTPNLPEAAILLDEEESMVRVTRETAERLAKRYGCAVYLKGGHDAERPGADLLWVDGATQWLESPVVADAAAHGTGCSLSAAMAANLAAGCSVEEAALHAKAYVFGSLENARTVGPDLRAMVPPEKLPLERVPTGGFQHDADALGNRGLR